MEQRFGLTAEIYRAIVAIVDERTRSIRVLRKDFDRLAEAQARTEAALNRLAEAQARTGARMEELAAAQARTEARMEELAAAQARTEARMEELAAAQARTEEEFRKYREASEARFARIEAALDRLAEAQARTEEEFRKYREASEARFARIEAALDRLAEAQARTEERLNRLAEVLERLSAIVERLDSQVADLRGWQLELRYYQRVTAYFGPVLRKARAVPLTEIEDELEAKLSEREVLDLLELDLLVYGEPRKRPDLPPLWLAVEISGVIDSGDITRAIRRAGLLRRAGFLAIPAVAGVRATDWIKEQAFMDKVLLLEDGRAFFWEEALSSALAT